MASRHASLSLTPRASLNCHPATLPHTPALLQGPTSSGKTSLVAYLAAQTGHTFVRINNHEQTDLQVGGEGGGVSRVDWCTAGVLTACLWRAA